MKIFKRRLQRLSPRPDGRSWIFVPYDQLSDQVGPLAGEDPAGLGIVLVENSGKARRRPYHKQKLALIIANLRQFALEQAQRGVAVRHVVTDGTYGDALEPLAKELGPLRVMEAAERELRLDLQPLVRRGLLEVVPHEGWLTSRDQFSGSQGEAPPWRMDAFYRQVRRDTGLLMEDGKPLGGKYSFDVENRRPWKGEPTAPEPPTFSPDALTEEACELVRTAFADHPGELIPEDLPTTREDAESLWSWAKENCIPQFGPFEDAMSTRSAGLFHTRVSSLLNVGRLLPRRLVNEVAEMDIPLASREGFIRQILGWREFVRHVHEASDGFRNLPADVERETRAAEEGEGAAPSFFGAERPLPPAYWGTRSGLLCLDNVVGEVWRSGYSHHITRLMVLSNLATLLDISPRELTDWFWVAYTDAYDWVVEPNVLGMGTFAAGNIMTTKPYVSGAAYIHRMSDYCDGCQFDPKGNCPITNLYWAFLARHQEALADLHRLHLPLASLKKRAHAKRAHDQAVFNWACARLGVGEELLPEDLPDAKGAASDG